MPAARRLDRDRSQLLVIDVQERLAPHVEHHEALIARAEALIAGAAHFGIPRILTEHCPDQIGRVVERLRRRFEPGDIFVKTRFCAADHAEFNELLAPGRTQVVVAGMEAHVCVMQTVLGLAAQGLQLFVVGDAVGSRAARPEDRRLALERMREAGCVVTATETVLFEWARGGDDPMFRETLRLVKGLP